MCFYPYSIQILYVNQCSQKNILYIVLAKFCLFGSKIENHIFSEKDPCCSRGSSSERCHVDFRLGTDHADIVFYWIINLLKTESVLCMYWLFFVCIGDHVYLEGPHWPVHPYVAVGPPLDRPVGLPTLSRRWTDRLVCRRWADVGPTAWFADVEPTLDRWTKLRRTASYCRQRADRVINGGPTADRQRRAIWVVGQRWANGTCTDGPTVAATGGPLWGVSNELLLAHRWLATGGPLLAHRWANGG